MLGLIKYFAVELIKMQEAVAANFCGTCIYASYLNAGRLGHLLIICKTYANIQCHLSLII
jgi:hypothetical protein